METYYVRCRKKTEKLNPKIFKTKNGRPKCPEWGFKRSRLVKE